MNYFIVLGNLLKFIKIIPTEDLIGYWNMAKEIIEKIDPEDVAFIAAALSKNHSAIWSDDRDFDQQNKILVFKTKDIINLLPK